MENTIIEHNALTGEIVERSMTKQELENLKEIQMRIAKHQEDLEKAEQAKRSARIKLAALGLTEDEIAAL